MTNPLDLPFQVKVIPGKDMYIASDEYNYCMRCKGRYSLSHQGCKTRPKDMNGVYKAKVLYEVTIKDSDTDQIVYDLLHGVYQRKGYPLGKFVCANTFFEQYLPDRNVILRRVDNIGTLFARDTELEEDVTFQFALIEDFEKVLPSKEELKALEENKKGIANQRMAELTVVGTIKEKLKEQGVTCTIDTHNLRKGISKILRTNDCGSYNKLVELALNYYLNDIVKDLGCILHVKPLHKNRVKPRTYYDDLVPLETVEFPTLNN